MNKVDSVMEEETLPKISDNRIYMSAKYGIGIPEDKLATIFDGAGSSSNSDSSRGMGIGLSICKTIVAAHDGTITACNIPGEVPTGHHFRHPIPAPCGAEFSFTLPRGDYSHTVSEEPL